MFYSSTPQCSQCTRRVQFKRRWPVYRVEHLKYKDRKTRVKANAGLEGGRDFWFYYFPNMFINRQLCFLYSGRRWQVLGPDTRQSDHFKNAEFGKAWNQPLTLLCYFLRFYKKDIYKSWFNCYIRKHITL